MDYTEILNRLTAIKDKYLGRAITSERDKKVLILGGVFLVLFVLFYIYQSYSSQVDKYEKQAVALEQQLVKVKALARDYEESTNRLESITRSIKKEDEALISVLEKILVDNRIQREDFSIKDSNTRISDTEDLYDVTSVQVDIRRVQLGKLIDVLYNIQTRESFLKVSDLKMRTKFDKPELIDASFTLSTFEFKKVI
mgnify:CR=1 FL=1